MKKERRITITVEEGISDATAFERLAAVAHKGRKVIGAKKKLHYERLTTWSDGIFIKSKPKYITNSDRFFIGRSEKYLEVTCPDCKKVILPLKAQKDLFSCKCGYYKHQTSILIKIKEHEIKNKK